MAFEQSTTVTLYARITILGMALIASIMSTTILSIMSPIIVEDFQITAAAWQIRNVVFFTVFACLMVFFGKCADTFNPKKGLILSLLGFSITCLGSFASAIAENWACFLFFQTLQAAADAAMVPMIMKMIKHTFPEARLSWAFGCFGAVLALGRILGPTVGASFQTNVAWPTVFIMLGAISSLALLALCFSFRDFQFQSTSRNSKNLMSRNLTSALALAVGMGTLPFLSENSAIVPVAILLMISLGYFVWNESSPSKESPYLPWRLLTQRGFGLNALRAMLLGLVTNVALLVYPAIVPSVFDIGKGSLSLALSSGGIALAAFGGLIGAYSDRLGMKAVGIGHSVLVLVSLLISTVFVPVNFWSFFIYYVMSGLAGSLVSTAQSKAVLSGIDNQKAGESMGFYHSIIFISGAFAGYVGGIIIDSWGLSTSSWKLLTLGSALISLAVIASWMADTLQVKEARNFSA